LYYAGTGPLKTDVQKAIELFTRSANAGHPPAQLALGQLLLEDQYVEMDRIAAWQWLALALEGGERSAQRALDKLATKMTSSEMTKANEALKKIRASRNDSNQNKEINKSE